MILSGAGQTVAIPADLEAAAPVIDALPESPAVLVIHAENAQPYLTRTQALRRRVRRLLLGNNAALLSHNATVEYWLTKSRLSASLCHYELAKRHHPADYLRRVRLKMPFYVRLTLSDEFPRLRIARRVSRGDLHYGPFRTQGAAEEFQRGCQDLFQIRRCPERLRPSHDHPGCVYGEMSLCLRPCQQVVTADEYATEARRAMVFLETGGKSLAAISTAARDRLSEEMQFEAAAREHARLEQITRTMKTRGELADVLDRLNGVGVSAAGAAVELRFFLRGRWLAPVTVDISVDPAAISLDRRLREMVSALDPPRVSRAAREEHMALLAKWFYSRWRDGEWVQFPSLEEVPYRKLVRAISKVARRGADAVTVTR